jgi:DNA-binding beta-propeller fold protein YncE
MAWKWIRHPLGSTTVLQLYDPERQRRMRMKSGWALAFVILPLAALMSCSSSTNVNTTGYVWVATSGDQKLSAFAVNLGTGATSPVGGQVATGAQPAAIAITPDRKVLFVANSSDDTVAIYTINGDQSLQPACAGSQGCTTATVPSGQTPVALAVDPSGKFLFVANQGTFADPTSGTISVFTISGTTLTQVGNPFPTEVLGDVTGSGPTGVIAAPAGNFLYVSNQFTNTVQLFTYDPTSGALTLPPTSYTAGTSPTGMAFSRCAGFTAATSACTSADGNNLFVANSGSNNVSVFTACIQVSPACPSANGSLIAVPGSPFASGITPTSLIVNPVANFVYVVDSGSNQISQNQYNSSTGALIALIPPDVSTSSSPGPGGITADGSVLFVPDRGGSTMSVYTANSVVSVSGTAPTGRLNPATTPSVSLTGQPSVLLVK